jgi:hypothetical protein
MEIIGVICSKFLTVATFLECNVTDYNITEGSERKYICHHFLEGKYFTGFSLEMEKTAAEF